MKKLLALALILLLLLSLTACAAEPQQAVGLSLYEAGLEANFPFTPIVPDYRGDKPLDYEITTDISFQQDRNASSLDVNLNQIGTLTALGKASPLFLSWIETHGEETLRLSATIGHYQVFRKSDLEEGKVIKTSFTLKQGLRYATEEPGLTYTVVLNKDTVKSSYHLVAETEDYYIFDWFTLIVGDQINDFKKFAFLNHFYSKTNVTYDANEYYIFQNTLTSIMNLKGHIAFTPRS